MSEGDVNVAVDDDDGDDDENADGDVDDDDDDDDDDDHHDSWSWSWYDHVYDDNGDDLLPSSDRVLVLDLVVKVPRSIAGDGWLWACRQGNPLRGA